MVASYVLSENSTRNEHELEFAAMYIEDFFIFRNSQCITHYSAQAKTLTPLAKMVNGKVNSEATEAAATFSKGNQVWVLSMRQLHFHRNANVIDDGQCHLLGSRKHC